MGGHDTAHLLTAILLLFLSPLCACAGRMKCDFRGHRLLPDGSVDLGGSLIGEIERVEFGLNRTCREGVQLLTLQRLKARDKDGKASWDNLTSLTLPRLASDEVLVFGHWSTCDIGSGPDPTIIAIVKDVDGPVYEEAVHAWRANIGNQSFDPLPMTRVRCTNEGYLMGD